MLALRVSVRRLSWFLVCLTLLVLPACGGADTAASSSVPLPGPGRTSFSSAQYGFTIRYPSDWHLVIQNDDAVALVLYEQSSGAPNAIAFEVDGSDNPQHLSAQDWW